MFCSTNYNQVKENIVNKVANLAIENNSFSKINSNTLQLVKNDDTLNNINGLFNEPIIQKQGKYYKIVPSTEFVLKELGEEQVRFNNPINPNENVANKYWEEQISENSNNAGEFHTILNYPEITEFTYNALTGFLQKLNPDFKIELVDNLSTEGVAYIKDFIIKLNSLDRFKAMPEEVSHFFVELLPDNSEMKADLLKSVVNFEIYFQTFKQYSVLPEYQTNGKPNIDKIKREAAAKLIAEFIYALSTGNEERINALTKPKQGWIKQWINKFFKWIGFEILNNTKIYRDVAAQILGQDVSSLKEMKDVDQINDSVFYKMTSEHLYENAYYIYNDLKPPRLLELINKFKRDFNDKFIKILKNPKLQDLNQLLSPEIDGITTAERINALNELSEQLKNLKIDFEDGVDAMTNISNIAQFLKVLDKMHILADAIYTIVSTKEKATDFAEAMNNISELENYVALYESFKSTISKELVQELIQEINKQPTTNRASGLDLINHIQKTQSKFEAVNAFIVENQITDLSIFFQEMFKGTNDNITKELLNDIKREEKSQAPNRKLIGELRKKINEKTQSNEKILALLTGRTKGIDDMGNFAHLLNAAIMNGNMYVSGLTKFIQDHLYRGDARAVEQSRTLIAQADAIEKEVGMTSYELGERIVQIDNEYDPTGDLAETKRQVLRWMNPFKGYDYDRKMIVEKIKSLKKLRPADKNNPNYTSINNDLVKAQTELKEFEKKYMNQEFKKEYYEVADKFHDNPDFIEAWQHWETLSKDISNIEKLANDNFMTEDSYNSLAQKRKERARLLQEVDEYGNPKSEEDIKIAKMIKDFFETTGKFKEVDTLQSTRAFLADRIRYEQKVDNALNTIKEENSNDLSQVENRLQELLKSKRIKIRYDYDLEQGSLNKIDLELIKSILLEQWDRKNIIIKANQKFYDDKQLIGDELNELQKKGELTEYDIILKDLYEEKKNLLYGYRDNYGEIDPNVLSEDTIDALKEIDENIEEIKKLRPKSSVNIEDFSEEDKKNYQTAQNIVKENKNAAKVDYAKKRIKTIERKYLNVGTSKKINDLFALLGELTYSSPTDYYWDKMDDIGDALSDHIHEITKDVSDDKIVQEVNLYLSYFKDTIEEKNFDELDFLIFESDNFQAFLDWMATSPKYEKLHNWFIKSHIKKRVWDNKDARGKWVELQYVRTSIYKVTTPVNEEHREQVFSKKHIRRKVKDEYRTGYNPETKKVKLEEGKHINNRNEWLPISVEDGQKDRKYINEEYYKLKNSNDDKDKLIFQYLELLKNTHLENQDKISERRLKSWMNVPVAQLDKYEEKKQLFQDAPEVAKNLKDKVTGFFKKNEADDADSQIEGMDTVQDIDQFTNKAIKEKVPKLGMMEKLPIERISKNLLGSTVTFIKKANEFEERSKAHPLLQALLRVMKAQKVNDNNKQIITVFEKLLSQHILEEVPDTLTNAKQIKRFAKGITGLTSLRLMADVPGGLINYSSAQINNLVEVAAGRHLGMKDYWIGNGLAKTLLSDAFADYSKKSDLSYNSLLLTTFDFIQGEWEEDIHQRTSPIAKKFSIRQHLMLPRKAGELHAQSALALGILNKNKAKNSIDGKEYPIHSIYAKEGNSIVLKEGFDKELYNPIDGSEFLALKKKIHRINMELHGNYAKINQTEASRHSLGKLVENMKRWFVTGFTRRWGRENPDITYEELNEGYYITAGKALWNTYLKQWTTLGGLKDASYARMYWQNERHKANIKRALADLTTWVLLGSIISFALGYAGDDKNKKLKENSYLHNLLILLAVRIYSESTSYVPLTSMGFNELKRNVFSPLQLPMDSVSNIAGVAQLMLYHIGSLFGADFEKDLYYSKDMGYWYSEKGDAKILKYFVKTFGHNGYTLEPQTYIKEFSSIQGRIK